MRPKAMRLFLIGRIFTPFLIGTLFLIGLAMLAGTVLADPLPSWNEGQAKQAIIKFVQAVTDKSGPSYVSPEQRIEIDRK